MLPLQPPPLARSVATRSRRPLRALAAVWVALAILCAIAPRADAEPIATVPLSSQSQVDLSPALELYEDTAGTLSLAEAQALYTAGRFGPHPVQSANHRQRAGVFWGRLHLRTVASSEANPPIGWLLLFAFPYARWNEVTLYPTDGSPETRPLRSGYDVPPSERAWQEPPLGFPLTLRPGEERIVYLRMVKQPHAGGFISIRNVEISLQSREHFLQTSRDLWVYQGIYLGIILIMIFYNLVIYTSEHDTSLLWYCGMLASSAVYFLEISGVGPYLPGLGGFFTVWDWYGGGGIILTLVLVCFGQFSRYYLWLHRYSRHADRLLLGLSVITAIAFFICYVSRNLQVGHYIIFIGALLSMIVTVGSALHAAIQGYRPALVFLIATLIMAISGSTNVVRMLFTKILYLPMLYAHLFQLGAAVQIALLSLGLAYRLRLLRTEREKSERLLRNVLPQAIAERLKSGERSIAERFEHVSVLFADIVGFTHLASQVGPEQIVANLNTVFSRFDELSAKYGLEKIKTIGDCYMVVAGVPLRRADHLEALLSMALELVAYMRGAAGPDSPADRAPPLHVRIGIHTGPVVAGVIGTHKFAFDLWGDTVNTASRMESHGEPDRIQCTPEVYERMQHAFVFEERGEIDIKGKGRMRTYFLLRRRTPE